MGEKSGSMFLIIGVLVVAVILISIFVFITQKGGDAINTKFDEQLEKGVEYTPGVIVPSLNV